jgi:hypothetical protein
MQDGAMVAAGAFVRGHRIHLGDCGHVGAARAQNAVDLREGAAIVGDVLEDLGAGNEVERDVVVGEALHVLALDTTAELAGLHVVE